MKFCEICGLYKVADLPALIDIYPTSIEICLRALVPVTLVANANAKVNASVTTARSK